MGKAKRAWIKLAAVTAMLLMLTSCIRLQVPGITSAGTATPTPTSTATPAVTPSVAPTMQDASGKRPVYNDTDRPKYDIQIKFDEKNHSATATERILYTNTAAERMNELYLHIYPNHFSKKEYVDMTFSSPDEAAYPDDKFNPGWIKITNLTADGDPVTFQIQGKDDTVLKIPLETPLMKGKQIELKMDFTLQVPHRMGRYAWGETGTNFANWYPIMAMYDHDGWNLDPYYELGDPFYSETADYSVRIEMPAGMEAAFTGDVKGDTTENGRRVLALSETGVRDFAFVLSRKYKIGSEEVDGITVRVAMPKEDDGMMDTMMRYATQAVDIYDRHFGRYTNDTLTVAFVDDYGGMEYPGIVFIDASLLKDEDSGFFLMECVVHEIGHQWWYSAVGNDEVEEPWLDESLTSFTELVYIDEAVIEDLFSHDSGEEPYLKLPLQRSLPEFKGWDDYAYIYTFGQQFFAELMNKMGEDEFFGMLQKYYAKYAYGIATSADLRALVAETGNKEALAWFDKGVYGKAN